MHSDKCYQCGGPSRLKYCSDKCRNRAANERRIERFARRKAERAALRRKRVEST